MLEGKEAQEAHDAIEKYIHNKDSNGNPFPEVLRGKVIQGMFRFESYDWTVFRFYREDNKVIFSHRHHVQHRGDCIKYLENKIV